MRINKILFVNVSDLLVRPEMLNRIKIQFPEFFQIFNDNHCHIRLPIDDTKLKVIGDLEILLKKLGFIENGSLSENSFSVEYETIYEDSDYNSADFYRFNTKDYFEKYPKPINGSYIIDRKQVSKDLRFMYHTIKPCIIFNREGLEIINEQNFKDIEIIPALENKLKGPIESTEYFILLPQISVEYKLIKKDGEGFPVPQYYEKGIKDYLSYDLIQNKSSLDISKRFYNFIMNSPLKEDVSDTMCIQVEK